MQIAAKITRQPFPKLNFRCEGLHHLVSEIEFQMIFALLTDLGPKSVAIRAGLFCFALLSFFGCGVFWGGCSNKCYGGA